MKKKITAIVSPEDTNLTLKTYLKSRLHLTKNEISRAKFRENGICINGERKTINTPLNPGDLVEVLLETGNKTSGNLSASAAPISILYEDADILIADKPAGISVHPAGKSDPDTLANRLAFYLRTKGEDSIIRIFGRLDKDTSGVILIAKNRAAATRLEKQRKDHTLFKTYLAVTEGIPDPAEGTINAPLSPDPKSRKQMCINPDGKSAVTCYKTLAVKDNRTLIRLRLETGRTHQIRVHMTSIGCPLAGDPLYGNEISKTTSKIKRTALHAHTIHFIQPFTGEEIRIKSPVPNDIRLIFPSEDQ